jgi:hypothetical protein
LKPPPDISKRAFWDIDFDKLDFYGKSDFIILKVFQHGKWDDIVSIIQFYGKRKVFKTLSETEHLTEQALGLSIIIFNKPKSKFKCSTQKQYYPNRIKPPPNVNRGHFWDTDYDQIDWDYLYHAVIIRILQNGSPEEVNVIADYYGKDKVLQVIESEFKDIENRQKTFHLKKYDSYTVSWINRLNARKKQVEELL